MRIEPVTIEKHIKKDVWPIVESNGGADVNKPDRGDRSNKICVQKNTIAASFSYENQKGLICYLFIFYRDNRDSF